MDLFRCSIRNHHRHNNTKYVRTIVQYCFTVGVILLLLTIGRVVNALSSSSSNQQVKYYGGAGVGKFVINDNASKSEMIQCHYDMILVERIQGRPKTNTGLFVPQQDLPKLHLCRIISIGTGKEEENGLIVPITGIHVNDIIIAKNPWGIGPRDEETMDGKKLSYMRFQDVAAVISGGLVPEEVQEEVVA